MSESPSQSQPSYNDPNSLLRSGNKGEDGSSGFGQRVRNFIRRAPDLKLEILGFVMAIVDRDCLRELRTLSEVRALWERTTGKSLFESSPEDHERFCKAVLCFHDVGRFKTHPGIRFANITVLQICVQSESMPLIEQLKSVFEKLRLEDLSLNCGDLSSFMTDAVQTWAPNLQNLKILRIFFNRFYDDGYEPYYPWLEDSWQSTLGLLSKLRTLWLLTSQVLCEEQISEDVYDSDEELIPQHQPITIPDNLVSQGLFKFMKYLAALWASENPSLSRIYYSFAYDDHWKMISPSCVGHRGRVMKLQDGTWAMTSLDDWNTNSTNRIRPDGLPGVLEDDIDMFEDDNIYW